MRDPAKMHADYAAAYPVSDDGTRKRTLTQFLNTDKNLKQYFEITYYSLDSTDDVITETFLESTLSFANSEPNIS